MIIRRNLWRWFLIFAAVFVGLPLLVAAGLVYRYSESTTDVRRVINAIAPEEMAIPALAVVVHARLDGRFHANAWAARQVIWAIHDQDDPKGDWHLRNMAQTILIPFQTTERERAALVWSRTGFLDGGGLAFGAEKYFGKMPAELSEEEMVRLWVIARSPRRVDRDPAKLNDDVAWSMRIWRGEIPPRTLRKLSNSGG